MKHPVLLGELLSVLVSGCRQASVKIEEVTPPVFEPGVIHSWGYRTTETGVLEQTAWQREHFGEATPCGNPGSGVWVIRI